MISIGEALVGSLTDTNGIDAVDVAKHTLPMIGNSLVAEAGSAAGSFRDTVMKTVAEE